MPQKWIHVRVPIELHERLTLAAAAMLAAYQAGLTSLPSAFVDNGPPLHHIIQTALDERESHQSRARQQSKRSIKSRSSAVPAVGVLTPVVAMQE